MHPYAIEKTRAGVFCRAGNFHIDPWGATETAVITHGHGDHARFGSKIYYCSTDSAPILKHRLGNVQVIAKRYGERFKLENVWVSLHSAGHILGSAQIRIEIGSHVTVISGDYKRQNDLSCTPFELVKCDEFLTESTFALPIYQWGSDDKVYTNIVKWWKANALNGNASILFCYSLGKAQRVLANLKNYSEDHVLVHGAIASLNTIYEEQGIPLIEWQKVSELKNADFSKSLILAPPSTFGSIWLRKFSPYKTAAASGWMSVRGTRRRRSYDTGFVLSDHADWPSLLNTIHETGAKKIWITHGNEEVLARYLREEENTFAQSLHLVEWSNEDEET